MKKQELISLLNLPVKDLWEVFPKRVVLSILKWRDWKTWPTAIDLRNCLWVINWSIWSVQWAAEYILTQHWRTPTRSTNVNCGLVASAGNSCLSCDRWLWYMVTFRSPLVRSVALSTSGHCWVLACGENAGFITQILSGFMMMFVRFLKIKEKSWKESSINEQRSNIILFAKIFVLKWILYNYCNDFNFVNKRRKPLHWKYRYRYRSYR